MVGVVGTMQALEAIKLLSGLGSRLVGRLHMIDGRSLEVTEMRLSRQPQCPVCGTAHR
jgi:bacteriocin biosynthesis cyclodehydratase domain-containing protein